MNLIFKYLHGDRVIWMTCFFLGLVSILAVYSSISSLAYKYQGDNTTYYLVKHSVMVLSGFALMYGAHRLDFKYFARLSQVFLWVSVVLLIVTLIFGTNINQANRWLTIPVINQNFQTSDLAKVALVAYLARMLSIKRNELHSFSRGVFPMLLPMVVICGLILPANFSTAAILFITCMVLMFVGGVPIKYLLGTVGVAIAGFGLLLSLAGFFPDVLPRLSTWKERIENFSQENPEDNYQVEHAMMAIHSGGVLPSGPGTGESRNYLPHPYSDMIYAFVIEEYGSILGGMGLLLLYLILLYRGLRLAHSSESRFGGLLVTGLIFTIVFQAMINMGVAVNLLPVTGQPLPLVSMGGTSLWFTCLAIGMILSVSRAVESGTDKKVKNRKVSAA